MVSFPVFINICVTENGCKVDITRKNIYNYCNVNLTFGGTMKKQNKRIARTARADARAIRRTGWSFKAGDKCHRNRKIRTIYLACI